MSKRILYLAPALPVLTCTFIYREIFDLRALGLSVDTVSMNTPSIDHVSEEAKGLLETTLYLDQVPMVRKTYEFLKAWFVKPLPMLRCLKLFVTASPMASFRDYRRLGYHWMSACYLASELKGRKPSHMHSHFITGATSINLFLSELIHVPFSFTMHASLIWTDPIALKTKLEKCKFCVSISEYNKNYVCSKYGEQWRSKIKIVHCGIPVSQIEPDSQVRTKNDDVFYVLAVGQLMKRKGFHVLVEAARILRDKNIDVSWVIVGEGNQRPLLEEMIDNYELHDNVKLVGAQPHEAIPGYLAQADVFTLPCVIGDDSTRDGIPVALMEAMSWGIPTVSTNIVGLPELIESGKDGILVEADNPQALADAITDLASSEELCTKLGKAAINKIDQEFNSMRSANQLATHFASSIDEAASPRATA